MISQSVIRLIRRLAEDIANETSTQQALIQMAKSTKEQIKSQYGEFWNGGGDGAWPWWHRGRPDSSKDTALDEHYPAKFCLDDQPSRLRPFNSEAFLQLAQAIQDTRGRNKGKRGSQEDEPHGVTVILRRLQKARRSSGTESEVTLHLLRYKNWQNEIASRKIAAPSRSAESGSLYSDLFNGTDPTSRETKNERGCFL